MNLESSSCQLQSLSKKPSVDYHLLNYLKTTSSYCVTWLYMYMIYIYGNRITGITPPKWRYAPKCGALMGPPIRGPWGGTYPPPPRLALFPYGTTPPGSEVDAQNEHPLSQGFNLCVLGNYIPPLTFLQDYEPSKGAILLTGVPTVSLGSFKSYCRGRVNAGSTPTLSRKTD